MTKLITKAQRDQLIKNGTERPENPKPVVKLFTPWANATWLLTELDPEDERFAFGLADLGLGFPEMGEIYLPEIEALRGLAGLRVERDKFFTAKMGIIEYADEARKEGRIAA